MTRELTKVDGLVELLRRPTVIDEMRRALPRGLQPERFVRMLTTSLRKRPELARCDRAELLGCFVTLAQLGLEPDTPLGHAWVIPYGGTPQVHIGYRGLCALAYRTDRILVKAEIVYERDQFSHDVAADTATHRRYFGPDRGERLLVYSRAIMPDKRVTYHFMPLADVWRIRARSKSWQKGQTDESKRNSPWYTDEDDMIRKTCVKAHCKTLPLSSDFWAAYELDNQAEIGQQRIEPVQLSALSSPLAEVEAIEHKIEESVESE